MRFEHFFMRSSKNIRHIFQGILLWYAFTAFCFARNAELEDLSQQLNRHQEVDTVRADIMIKMIKGYDLIDKDSMFRYCNLLFNEAQQSKNSLLQARANTMMGMYWQKIQPGKALDYYRQSYDIYKKTDDKKAMAEVNRSISVIYNYMNDYDKQLFYLKRALQEALECGDKKIEILILHNISGAYFYLKNYELAEEYSLMALRESRNNGNYISDPIMVSQAGIEFQKGNYKRAIELSEDILNRARKKGQTQIETVCLKNIAECLIKTERYREARLMLAQCFQKTDPETDMPGYVDNLQLLVMLDSATGNFKQAFLSQREIERLTEQIHSLDQIRNNSEKALQIELQDMQAQDLQLRSIYEEKENQYAKMNIFVIILIIVTSAGIFLFVRLRRSSEKLRREESRLREKREDISEKKNKLISDNQDLRQKKIDLAETHHSLDQSDRSKTELFKTMSDDLRSPLIRLKQDLVELMAADMSEDRFRRAVGELTDNVGNISLLLENLLQWSKIQSQGVRTTTQYTEMIMLVDDAFGHHKYGAAEKNITLSNAMKHRLYVYADEETIKGILKTLLQNMIRLSGNNAVITVSGDKNEQYGRIRINYQGQMPLKTMFLQLYETNDYGSDRSEIGKAVTLGWMLCRTLIETNNGYIRTEDISEESFNVDLYLPLEESGSKI